MTVGNNYCAKIQVKNNGRIYKKTIAAEKLYVIWF